MAELQGSSNSLWTISPPSRQYLSQVLSLDQFPLTVSWTIQRWVPQPPSSLQQPIGRLPPQEPEPGRQSRAGVRKTRELPGRRHAPAAHPAAERKQDAAGVSAGDGWRLQARLTSDL